MSGTKEAVLDSMRKEIETILARPGADVVDALVAWTFATVTTNRQEMAETAYRAGMDAAEEALGEALRKARSNGSFSLGDVARDIALATRGNADAPVLEYVARMLAALLQLQRDTDRAILVDEANRRLRVAETYPDLEGPARASVSVLSFAAGLIEAGLVPENVAVMVATARAARAEQAAEGSLDNTPTALRDAKRKALAFLLSAASTRLAAPLVKVHDGKIAIGDGPAVLPDQAEAMALALLCAAYDMPAPTPKRSRRPTKGTR